MILDFCQKTMALHTHRGCINFFNQGGDFLNKKVLIHSAAGGVGSMLVALSNYYGAKEIVGMSILYKRFLSLVMNYQIRQYFQAQVAEIILVKNVRAIVVCGFLMK